VPGARQTFHTARPASTRKRKASMSCHKECRGFTAAGRTCLTKAPDCFAAGAHCSASLPVCFFATGSQRPANRPATRAISSVRTTPCYQKLLLYPRQYTCTIKGIFDGGIVQGTVGPVVASE
jgi:hypothetical protein